MNKYIYILIAFLFLLKHATAQVSISPIQTYTGICTGDGKDRLLNFQISENLLTDFTIDSADNNNNIFSILPPLGYEFEPGRGNVHFNSLLNFNKAQISVSASKMDITLPSPHTIVPFYNTNNTFSASAVANRRKPLGATSNYERSAALYTKDEINRSSGTINAIGFYLENVYSSAINNGLPIEIYLLNTSSSTLSRATVNDFTAISTLVYNNTISSTAFTSPSNSNHWVTVVLENPFFYNSTQNLVVIVKTNAAGILFNDEFSNTKRFRLSTTSLDQFQYWDFSSSLDDGSVQGTLSKVRPNIMLQFSSVGIPTAESVSISGVNLVAKDALATGILSRSGSGMPINGLPYGAPLGGYFSSVIAGAVFNLKDDYCANGSEITVTGFPSNGVYSTSGGNFFTSTGTAGVARFNPAQFTDFINSTFNFVYSYPGIGSCSTVEKSITINSLPPTPLLSASPSSAGYPYGSNVIVTLSATNFSNVSGTFTGEGVVGNRFFVDFTSTVVGNKLITYSYKNTLTGCNNFISRNLVTFDPKQSFRFNLNPPSVPGFCASDNSQYDLSLNVGIQDPQAHYTTNPGAEPDFVSTSANSVRNLYYCIGDPVLFTGTGTFLPSTFGNGVVGVRSMMNSFKFNPSVAGIGTFDFNYAYDFIENTLTGEFVSPKIWRTIQVNVLPKPESPGVSEVYNYTFCKNAVVSTSGISVSTTATGATFKWFTVSIGGTTSLTPKYTSSGTDIVLSNILEPNYYSVPGIYLFAVSQVVDGCESSFSVLTITIKDIPSVPGISNTNSELSNFCKGSTYDVVLQASGFESGASLFWYDDAACTNLIGSGEVYSISGVNDNYSLYLIQESDGCRSNEFITTTTGPLRSVLEIDLVFNSLPNAPTVLGTNTYCAGQSIAMVTVQGVFSKPLTYNWFVSSSLDTYATDPTGVTVTAPGILSTNVWNSGVNNTLVGSSIFYVESKDQVTGCVASVVSEVLITINAIPDAPQVVNRQIGTVNDTLYASSSKSPFCFDANNADPIVISVVTATGASYVWYEDSSLMTSISGVSTVNSNIARSNTSSLPEDFFVVQVVNGCSSTATRVLLKIEPPVPAPTVTAPAFKCTGDIITPISASPSQGYSINWYKSISTTVQPIFTGNSLSPVVVEGVSSGVATVLSYMVAQSNVFGCDSRRNISTTGWVFVDYEIRQKPEPPMVFDSSFCVGAYSLPPLRAQIPSVSGATFRWYESNNTSSILGTGVTSTVSTITTSLFDIGMMANGISITGFDPVFLRYSVDVVVNGCPSNAVPISMELVPIPPQPDVATNASICTGQAFPSIQSSSLYTGIKRFVWYRDSMLSTSISGSSTVNLNDSIAGLNLTTPGWTSPQAPPTVHRFYATQITNFGPRQSSRYYFEGCQSPYREDTLAVYPIPPLPSIISAPAPYCSQQSIQVLTADGEDLDALISWYTTSTLSPVGKVVSNTRFPYEVQNVVSTTTSWNYYVTQSYNNCESAPFTQTITVNPLPIVNISGLMTNYCEYEPRATISGSYMGGVFITTMPGFVDNGDGSAFFDPTFPGVAGPLAPVGRGREYTISYQYVFTNTGCANSTTRTVRLSPKPAVSLTGLSSLEYCAYEGNSVGLSLSPTSGPDGNGTLSIQSLTTLAPSNGLSGIRFVPALAGVDSFMIKYVYRLSLSPNCKDSVQQKVIVRAVPNPDFTISSLCAGDSIRFVDASSIRSPDQIVAYNWRFGQNTFTSSNFISLIREPRNYAVSLGTTSQYNCFNEVTKNFVVGPYPVANFSIKNTCLGDSTLFENKSSIASGTIKEYRLNIDGANELTLASLNFRSVYPLPGIYRPKLTVVSDKGCMDTANALIVIKSVLGVTKALSYFQDFNQGAAGWYVDGINSSFKLTNISKQYTQPTSSQDYYWTPLSTLSGGYYNKGESSYIYSPCFDLSDLDRPMLSFSSKTLTRNINDGAVLQAQVYNGQDESGWIPVNFFGSGIGWFTQQNIFSRPGQEGALISTVFPGWSGDGPLNTEWTISKNALKSRSLIKPELSRIRFRFAFASTSDPQNDPLWEGFSFDNFSISNARKTVLIESFGNANVTNSAEVDDYLNKLVNSDSVSVVSVRYHASFPVADVFNQANQADPSARVLYYGVKQVPTYFHDGVFPYGYSQFLERDEELVSRMKLEEPAFEIQTSKNLSADSLIINYSIAASKDLPDSNWVIHVAVVERSVFEGSTKNKYFESVLRKMLPDASGRKLKKSWSKGESLSGTVSMSDLSTFKDLSQLGVVVFVQNFNSKKVHQAQYLGPSKVYSPNPVLSITKSQATWSMYPNPAQHFICIQAESELVQKIQIRDMLGKSIAELSYDALVGGKKIDVSSFADGIYYVTLLLKSGESSTKKIIINR